MQAIANKSEANAEKPPRRYGFVKGKSGNPSGRPKVIAVVRDLAREHTPEALKTLVKIMKNDKANDSARVAAARELLNRGWGMPQQDIGIDVKIDVAKTLADALDSLSRKAAEGSVIDITPVVSFPDREGE